MKLPPGLPLLTALREQVLEPPPGVDEEEAVAVLVQEDLLLHLAVRSNHLLPSHQDRQHHLQHRLLLQRHPRRRLRRPLVPVSGSPRS